MKKQDVTEKNEMQTTVASPWRCQFGWHDWKKWKMGECSTTSIFFKGERAGLFQMRKCQRCGKTQMEMV